MSDNADHSSYIPAWRGFHHVALVTRDLDATIRFYQEVLGMELVKAAPAGQLHGRHCVLRPGSDTSILGLHFFEYSQAPYFGPEDHDLIDVIFKPENTFLSHISFALPDEVAGLTLRDRLVKFGVTASPIMDEGSTQIMVFIDNNGIALEANWPIPGK